MSATVSSPFLRQTQRTRRRRPHPFARVAARLSRLMVTLVLPVAAAWWVMSADRLALAEVTIGGSERIPVAWVEETLAPWRGHNLLLLPLARVERAILSHPWAASVTARKALPNRLIVEIADRPAVASLVVADQEILIDALGGRIAPLEGPATGLRLRLVMALANQRSRIDGLSDGELVRGALELDRRIAELVPAWSEGLETIEILGQHDFRLWHRSLDYPILAGVASLHQTLPAYRGLEAEIHRRYPRVETVDLRIRGRIVVRPLPPESGWPASETRGS